MAAAATEQTVAEFACPVCYEPYVLTEPKSLPSCGHSVCAQCADALIEAGEMGCPVCRKVNVVPDGGLVTNYALKGACEAFARILEDKGNNKEWPKWLTASFNSVVQKGIGSRKNDKQSPETASSSASSGSDSGPLNTTRVLLIGGYNAQETVEEYSPRNASKNHILDCQPSVGRYRHVAGIVDGKPWIAGGTQRTQAPTDNSDKPLTLRQLDSSEFYDLESQKWKEGPTMSSTRELAAGAVCLGHFFVFGGLGAAQTGEMLTKGLLWGTRWTRITDMKSPTWSAAAIGFGNKVFIFGGESPVVSALSPVQIFHPEKEQWTFGREMSFGRKELAAVALDENSVIISGGWDADRKILKSCERLDTRTNVWSSLSPMTEVRAGHSLVNCAGRVLTLGGRCSRAKGTAFMHKSVEEFDARVNRWRIVAPLLNENWAFTAVVV